MCEFVLKRNVVAEEVLHTCEKQSEKTCLNLHNVTLKKWMDANPESIGLQRMCYMQHESTIVRRDARPRIQTSLHPVGDNTL